MNSEYEAQIKQSAICFGAKFRRIKCQNGKLCKRSWERKSYCLFISYNFCYVKSKYNFDTPLCNAEQNPHMYKY